MRNLLIIILILGICGKTTILDAAIVAGEVRNSSTKSVQISIPNGNNIFLADKFVVEVDRKKKFRLDLETGLSGIILIDGFQIYLEPTDSIFLKYDQGNLRSTIQFSGDRVDENIFMLEYQKVIGKNIDKNCFDLNLGKQEFLDPYLTGNFSGDFESFLSAKISYAIVTAQIVSIFQEVAVEKKGGKEALMEVVDRNLEMISINNPPYFTLPEYYYFLDWYSSYQVAFKGKYKEQFDESDWQLQKLKVCWDDLDIEALETVSAEFIVRSKYSPEHYTVVDSVYAWIVQHFPNSPYIAKLEQFLPETVTTQGEIELLFYEHDSQIEVASFSEIISGIGNKPVLVDIWATWCHPCIQQFKYLPDIKNEIGDEFDFLYLSVDELSKKDRVLNLIDRYQLEGTHAFLRQDDLIQFGSQGIPAYLLYSSDGELLSGDVPVPGTGKYFVKHLRKYAKK